MIVLTNRAKPVLLTQKLSYLRSLLLRLYKNDVYPSGTDQADDYQEATFGGYAPQLLEDFSRTFQNTAGQGQTNTCPHLFTQTVASPENLIYGYFVTDSHGFLIFAERRIGGPVPMVRVGDVYSLTIQFLEDTLR